MKKFKQSLQYSILPLYLIKLSDLLYKKEIVKLIKDKFDKTSEIVYFNITETPIEKILNETLSSGVFVKKKIVVCNEGDLLKETDLKKILNIFSKIKKPKNSILIIFFDKVTLKNKYKYFFEIKLPSIEEMKKFIIIFFKKNGIEVDFNLANFIVENCGYDFNKVSIELRKILSFAEGKKKLNINDIKDLIKFSGEENVYRLIDFFFEKNFYEAIKTFYNLKTLNVNILFLIAIFQKSIINLAKVKSFLSDKNINVIEIESKTSIPQFVLKKFLRYEKNFTFEKLHKIYNELYELELLAKTSSLNIEKLFENFLIKNLKWH